MQTNENLIYAFAWDEGFLQFGNHFVFFLADIGFQFLGRHVVVVFGFEGGDHAAEVLADEFGEELRTGVAVGDAAGFEDLIGEVGTGGEGKGFGKDEGVVAVEEEGGDLLLRAGVSRFFVGFEGETM